MVQSEKKTANNVRMVHNEVYGIPGRNIACSLRGLQLQKEFGTCRSLWHRVDDHPWRHFWASQQKWSAQHLAKDQLHHCRLCCCRVCTLGLETSHRLFHILLHSRCHRWLKNVAADCAQPQNMHVTSSERMRVGQYSENSVVAFGIAAPSPIPVKKRNTTRLSRFVA